ncbi:MAG: hypothetical protein EOP50_03205, partial [Sphingobacteriales bacterium]
YLQISNFSNGTGAPVLYDLTNGLRLVANTDVPGQFRFVLPPSADERRLVLVRGDGSALNNVTAMQARTFTNFAQSGNTGDYLVITHPFLTAGAGGSNPVEEYRAYRASANGGGYNAKIYMVDDLIDQFGFGIKSNPLGIANFLRYARNTFPQALKGVFIVGKGVVYNQARIGESNPLVNQLNLIPTWGYPASDNLLVADLGSSRPHVPIGRLSVVWPYEVSNYLAKVREFEAQQRVQSPLIGDKAWMKNVVHLAGSTEPALLTTLSTYLDQLKDIVSDTLFGGHVTTFIKNSPNTIQQINNGELDRLFAEGISLITYFGHSASSHLEYNLNNPDQYNNPGKYPLFMALGCNVGNVYNLNGTRLNTLETISEQYTLAPGRGSIGFIASSHFGITDYLQNLSRPFYANLSSNMYGETIGSIMNKSVGDMFDIFTEGDFYARATAEESNLDGDPVLRLNPHDKPDYAIEDQLVRVTPGFVSVADNSFHVTAQMVNLGRAINHPVIVEVARQYPNGGSEIIYRDTLPGVRYIDSVGLDVPIEPNRDKGLNRITVTIDPANEIDEKFESNNSITKDVFIYEDEARPVYPYNFAIVNRPDVRFVASTANPFASTRTYRMELDTTERFNSPSKVTTNITAPGGVLEFRPSVNYQNNIVYYWRVAEVVTSGNTNWSGASFLYIASADTGFNQSHYYQYRYSDYRRMQLDSATRNFQFTQVQHEIYIRNCVFPEASTQAGDVVVNVDGESYIRNFCTYGFAVNVFDKETFRPWVNVNGAYGSAPAASCYLPFRKYNYQFTNDTSGRRKMMQMLQAVPDGNIVVVRNVPRPNGAADDFAPVWRQDQAIYGPNTLYNELLRRGFTLIDSVNRARAFAFVYKKGDPTFIPTQGMTVGRFDVMSMSVLVNAADSVGTVTSPQFGPASAWKHLQWSGHSLETPSTDTVTLSLLGVQINGTIDTLLRGIRPGQNDIDISNFSAATYPYMRLHLNNTDTSRFTPYQVDYWRLYYSPRAEGAVAPNLLFSMRDTFDVGEPVELKLAFKNTVFVDVNPNNDQPELYHFNNFIYKNFFVRGDTLNPLLDVTFDNRHILNGDIVSSRPQIDIRLKDEAKWRLLDDTSLVTVQVVGPLEDMGVSPVTRSYGFDNDTLRFEPATSGNNNQATVHFKPYFDYDGKYQLIVSGKDKSGNGAGRIEYKVGFEVINKAMISNMLNYPNPFTTSTAFVFTITGSEVPQNIRIQILTITGKVVRDITKEELGPLHIGTNITEFKWDGTDQYGQKLANGVYL